jgi:hypothetical protein
MKPIVTAEIRENDVRRIEKDKSATTREAKMMGELP